MPVEDMQKLEEAPKDEVEQLDASAQMAPDKEAVTEVPTEVEAASETTESPVMPVEDMQKEKKELFFELVVLQIIFKITFRILIFVSVTVIILGLVFVTYALISYLSNNATLNMINDQINKIEFLDKGLIDFVFDLFRRIGV